MTGPSSSATQRSEALLSIIVAAVFASVISRGHFAATGDAPHYMIVAQSIILDGDIDLANDYADANRIVSGRPEAHAQLGRHGYLRPVHDIGFPVLSLPLFAAAYGIAVASDGLPPAVLKAAKLNRFIALRQCLSVGMIGLTLFLMTRLRRAISVLPVQGGTTVAAVAAGLFALSPPLMSVGYVFVTEVPSAIVCLMLFTFAAQQRDEVPPSIPIAFLLGIAVGVLVLIHVRNLGLAVPLSGALWWKLRSDRRMIASFCVGLLALIVCRVTINVAFWGSVVTGPQARVGEWGGLTSLLTEMAVRSLGMLFDPRHGLLATSPIYMLAPAGLLLLARRDPVAARLATLIAGAYLALLVCPITNDHGWRGGWSPPARFWAPISPLLFLGIPTILSHRRGRVLASAIGLWQLAIDVKGWTNPMLLWSEGPGPSPLLTGLLGQSAGSLFVPVERLDLATLLVCTVGIGAVVFVTWVCTSRRISETCA